MVVLVAAVAFAAQHFWSGRTQPVPAPDVVGAASATEHEERSGRAGAPSAVGAATGGTSADGGTGGPGPVGGAPIVVDVSGKVRRPGLQRLPPGARVADALRAAGGVRPGVTTVGLNRARFLMDGEQVVVGENPAPAPGDPAPAARPGAAGPVGQVGINTATLEQLDALPGVGPVLAQHIVDYRTEHGGFRSIDELREVKGIGEARFHDLHDLVRP